MSFFLFRRCLSLLLTLVAASLVVFGALEWLPGDAAQVAMGPDASPEVIAAKRTELGLERPATERYLAWVGGLLRGDMGQSHAYGSPVAELIAERLAVTLPLALLALAISTAVALSVGVYAAAHHNRLGDVGVMTVTQLGIAVPNFWFAILLILVFSVKLQWFSAGGFDGWSFDDGLAAGLWTGLRALLLPALALAAVQAAILARFTRSAVLDVMREDFVRTARAKGNSRAQTLRRHVLRNALVPVVTILGMQFSELVVNAIVVENVFYLPGIGRLVFQAIANRDLIVVQNVVMLLAALVIVVNFAVDVAHACIDPRVRAGAL
ncbi:ABC transporter permease [Comamonas serinivorans]|uniref:ABC transporter permease n=1 Tax=Comamonas serinivorans TaxID=1082851 RepID=A0A1Y0EK27_9BURK|nr:ABC transporter permease [Comamonas serinivorans]ARU03993.1 ABC transporter permease [Comamonas serinivorans]